MTIKAQELLWLPKPADDIALESNEVHIWRAALLQPDSHVQFLRHILSPDETQRAEQYHFPEERQRFINSRGILKDILGLYLNIPPEKIRFRNNSFGKPFVDIGVPQIDLQFSMSRSHDLALYAITCNRQIGIDIEYIHPILEIDQLIHRFFSLREKHAIRSVSPDHKLDTFFRYWTYKEAYIKAIGAGLSVSLNQFDIFDSTASFIELYNIQEDFREDLRQHTPDISHPSPEYVATLAITEASSYRLSGWQWQK